jgi:hypothetical protein
MATLSGGEEEFVVAGVVPGFSEWKMSELFERIAAGVGD